MKLWRIDPEFSLPFIVFLFTDQRARTTPHSDSSSVSVHGKRVAFPATLTSRFVFYQALEITCPFRRRYLYVISLPGPFSDLPDLHYRHIYLPIVGFLAQYPLRLSPDLGLTLAHLPASTSCSPRVFLLLSSAEYILYTTRYSNLTW